MDKQQLTKIVELFVVKEKSTRLLEFISSPNGWDGLPKRYRDFVHELLNDPRNIDPKYIVEEFRGYKEHSEIVKKLRILGAGNEAYLVSVDWDADGKTGK